MRRRADEHSVRQAVSADPAFRRASVPALDLHRSSVSSVRRFKVPAFQGSDEIMLLLSQGPENPTKM
jgi:hypothetical protein